MNYFKYWFKGFGYTVGSIHEGMIFEQTNLKKQEIKGPPFQGTSLFNKKFLIMTSLNFKDGRSGHCLIDLGLFKKEFKEGGYPFSINLDCDTPFKSKEREKSLYPKISKSYSIKLKPVSNFNDQRSFRYFVESKRWPMALRFLKKGVDPKIYMNKYNNIGTTPLNIAFRDFRNFYNRIHSIPFINELLQVKGVLNFKDASGKTSLVKSLLENKRLVAKKLIHEGAVLIVRNKTQKETFLTILKGYKMEKKDFLERFYMRLRNTSQFPTSISIKKTNKND